MRYGLICLTLLLLLVIGSACQSGTVREAPTMPAVEAPITLRLATGDSGSGLVPYQNIVALFEREHPEIEVEIVSITANYYDTLLAQVAAAELDLLMIGEDALPRFVAAGALEPIDPYLNGSDSPLDPAIYLPGLLRPGAYQDQQYLLPKDYSPVAVFYNKALFDAAEVEYPEPGWTWQDFRRKARALTNSEQGIYGVQLPANWPRGFEYWVAAAGGRLINAGGNEIEGLMDSDEVVRALQFYADLYHTDGSAAPATDLSAFSGGEDFFAQGKAAMRLFGRWPQTGYLENQELRPVLGVAPPPVGDQPATVLAWAGFGIAATSDQKEAAWQFLRFLSGPQGAEEWANWGLPAVRLVAISRGIDHDPLDGVWLATLDDVQPIAAFASPYWGEVGEPELRQALETIITDPNADPRTVLEEAAARAQAALDARRNEAQAQR